MIEPALTGPGGKAWSIPLGSQNDGRPDEEASIAMWLVEQPGVHPFWSRWTVCLIHLRDIPGARPAVKRFQNATHEIQIYALDPKTYGNHEALPGKVEDWGFMHPVDCVHQFEVPADAIAVEIVSLAVRLCVDGGLACDTDYASHWARLIDGTAAHYRDGRHGLG